MELLRQLEHDQVLRWKQAQTFTPPMIEAKDCDPALLSGWTERDISVWDVSDSDGKPGLQKILVALCMKNMKKDWEKTGYLLFPHEEVSFAGLQLTQSNGSTGDNGIDLSNTHYEIRGITGKDLCTLIHTISRGGRFRTGVFKRKDMDALLYETWQKSSIETATGTAAVTVAQDIPAASGTQAASPVSLSATDHPPQQAANEGRLPRSSADTTA